MSVLNISAKKLIVGAAVPMAVLASGGLVWQSSYSAFSATTASPTNNWSAGTVALSDDDSDTALFTASNLKPGATGTKCIAVTSTGSLASTVKLYGTNYATTNALASNINLKIEEGTGATNASCAGFTGGSTLYDGAMNTFGTTKTSFATGVSSWAPTGGNATKSYRITYTLSASTPDSAQGGTAALGFTWESQNS
jgi:camelysin-like metallo-endopeptidase